MREWQSLWLSVARNSDTLNLLVFELGLVSWCWIWRLEAGGLPPRSDSSAVWLTPELGKWGGSCVDELNRPGVCVGVRCWHAPRPELWQTACWNSQSFLEQMETFFRRTKSSGTLFSRVWRHDPQSATCASGLAQFSTCITDLSSLSFVSKKR